jgi:hypothetical protein
VAVPGAPLGVFDVFVVCSVVWPPLEVVVTLSTTVVVDPSRLVVVVVVVVVVDPSAFVAVVVCTVFGGAGGALIGVLPVPTHIGTPSGPMPA